MHAIVVQQVIHSTSVNLPDMAVHLAISWIYCCCRKLQYMWNNSSWIYAADCV